MVNEKVIPDIPIVALSGDNHEIISRYDNSCFVDICILF